MVKLSSIKANPQNPREISEEHLDKLKGSIEQFPKMFKLRPIILDEQGMVLGGNMRLKALQELGFKEIPDEWVKRAEELTEEEKKRFIIADNIQAGVWQWDMLAEEWDIEELLQWGLELPEEWSTEEQQTGAGEFNSLQEGFGVPPFTVLDSRQGYWKERKQVWHEQIKDKGESREAVLSKGKNIMSDINNGTSILDPVLAEIALRWFNIPDGKTFDPFAGDTVFGYVAQALKYPFKGIELRQEQVDVNNSRMQGGGSVYVCDDAQNISKHFKPNSMDLMFSCPPYFDLEIYSDLPNDASNQKTFLDYMAILNKAFVASASILKKNRFAVIVVGDMRDKDGAYLGIIESIKNIMQQAGMVLYNELIYVEPLGTLPQRVGRWMVNRKVGKCHQNMLIFYKGNIGDIQNVYPKINIENDGSEDVEA